MSFFSWFLFLILLILGLVIIIETGFAAALFLCGGGRKLGMRQHTYRPFHRKRISEGKAKNTSN
jgi:hypothetical protein